MAEEDTEYLKLSVEERCVHKLWKARVSGYEEAAKLFSRLDEENVGEWKKYGGLMKKFVTDSNAIAQEKALDAVLVFAENAPNAPKLAEPISEGLVQKGLAAPKTKTKESSLSILLMLCEVEAQETVTAELIKGLEQKNPKVVAASINALKLILKNFGAKVIKVSPLLKATMPLLDHRDKGVREEGKQLIIEAYRWVGDLMKQQLTSLKPVQISELEKEFEELKSQDEPTKPLRLLRSQQMKMASAQGTDEGDQENEGNEEEEEKIDPFDIMDAVNVVDQIPKNFYQLMEEKKWQSRKEALDALLPLVQTPKIESGDFNDLVRILKRTVAKDANVVLVAMAAQCLSCLAKGLRNNFKNHAASCLPVVLEKLKEKKQNVVTALVDALDNFYPILGIEAVQEDCFVALKHKTPAVNAETAKFLARCFATCPPALQTNKKVLKGYVSVLSEKLTHSDVTVRDASSEALATLFKLLGEPAVTKLMPAEVASDTIKINKIKELMEKVELKGKKINVSAVSAGPKESENAPKVIRGGAKKTTATTGPGPSSNTKAAAPKGAKPSEAPAAKSAVSAKKPAAAKTSSAKSTARQPLVSSKKKAVEIDDSPLYHASDLKKTRFRDEAKLKVLKWNFTVPRQEFVDLLQEQMTSANFNSTLISQMFHSDFKQHLKALETLTQNVNSDVDALIANLDLLLKWSTLRFFETNPSVLLKTLDYLKSVFKLVSEQGYMLHEIEAISFIPYIVNKTGEPKDQMRNTIKTIIRLLGEVYPATKVSSFLLDGLKSKNAKQRAEVLDELCFLIKNHGSSVLQPAVAQNLKDIAKIIADRDNSVRNNAINCITEVYFQDGDKIYKAIGNLPEKDMSLLEERIKRASKTRNPPGSNPPVAAQRSSSQDRDGPTPSKPPSANGTAASASAMMPPPSVRTATFSRRPQTSNAERNPVPEALAQDELQTTRPATTNSRIGRPISGAFKLDLDKIESAVLDSTKSSSRQESSRLHNLVKFPDIDEILNDKPVNLPGGANQRFGQTAVSNTEMTFSTPSRGLSDSKAPANDLSSSPEALSMLDATIASVRSSSKAASLSGLSQLDRMFKDPSKINLMTTRVDAFFEACQHQFNLLASGRDGDDNEKDTMRLLQYLTVSLMTLYHHPEIARLAAMEPLKGLVDSIIKVLASSSVQSLSNAQQLIRHLNVLMAKIVDRSDCTNLTVALIGLMEEAHQRTSEPKYIELVMKCLWKVVQWIPTWINQSCESNKRPLDVSVVLARLHKFLRAFPSTFWKQQSSDMPFKTVKTIVHALVKEKQEGIFDYLGQVDDPTASEMVPYIKKLVSSGVGKENQNTAVESSQRVPSLSRSHEKALADIFGKIGQKPTTKEGLRELYIFKKSHPDADLEPFLANTSVYFRNYIENGLKNAADDDANNGAAGNSGGTEINGENTGNQYMNRLRALREKAGLI